MYKLARAATALGVIAITMMASAEPSPPTTEVFVLGTLYKRHETIPTYDLPALRRAILAIAPQVLVVDCTPREVETQTVHPSKVEYPGVIFPFIRETKVPVYPAEPGEPMFTEIVTAVAAAYTSFDKNSPEAAAAMKQYTTAAYAALAASWQSIADSQDATTATVLAARKALNGHLVGSVALQGEARWNRHWADRILDAVARHPGQRVLAVTGIENRGPIVDMLKQDARVTVVDMPSWLRAHEREAPKSAPASKPD